MNTLFTIAISFMLGGLTGFLLCALFSIDDRGDDE